MSIQDLMNKEVSSRLYSKIQNLIHKEPTSGDDLIVAARILKEGGDSDSRELFQIASQLTRDEFFDEFYYRIAKYEKTANTLDEQSRINMLKDMMEYSNEMEYSVELICLYLSLGEKSPARKVAANTQNLLGVSDELDLLLDDVRSGTENYRDILSEIDSRRDDKAENETQPETPLKKGYIGEKTEVMPDEVTEETAEMEIQPEVSNAPPADEDGYPEIINEKFKGLIGMKSVKQQLTKLYNRLVIDKARSENGGTDAAKKGYNFILYGNPGTGKTTVARVIAEVLYQSGMLQNNILVETDRSGLVGQYIGETAQKTKNAIDQAQGGTLFIDEAYALYKEGNERDFGKEAIDTLLKDIEDNRGEYCVILAGYKDQMKNMIRKANAGFSSRFDYHIEIPDYSDDELYEILKSLASAQNLTISDDVKKIVYGRIEKERIDETFDNARFMRRLLDSAIEKQAMRLMGKKQVDKNALFQLIGDDFKSNNTEEKSKSLEDYLNDLNKMIGLASVKSEIQGLVETIQIHEERKKRNLPIKNAIVSYHMAFTGNPGTGKTTVARLFGKILAKLGILKREDVFVECSRADLVGNYQGHTATKTKDVVYKALGGVLFLDEAYNLVNGSHDSFGMEALNTLLAEMENKRDRLVVIIAGYSKEIEDFMSANPGLKSRIPRIIEFPDYSTEEMTEIFIAEMKKRGYDLGNVDLEEIRKLIDEKRKVEDFGNARGVRNICDKVERNQNRRSTKALKSGNVSDDELMQIVPDDLCIE